MHATVYRHIADAIKMPDVIQLGANLSVARFESMKVFSAQAAVEHLLQKGIVQRGDTLLDSSSGIYAYALALACHQHGLRCHIVASQTVDRSLMLQLQLLGATVQQVPTQASLKLDQRLRVNLIQDLLAQHPHMHWMQQYHDDIHYLGYRPVAELIRANLDTRPLCLVGGVGSGCSTGGLITALREHDPDTRLVGVQPFGSVTFGSEHIEDPGIIIAGIGSAIPFRNVRHALYDQIDWVSFAYGRSGTVALLRQHALFAGLSSGCCYLVAQYLAAREPDWQVVFLAADGGHRYLESVFATHQQAAEITGLQPRQIHHLDELALPWSSLSWQRRPFPLPHPHCTTSASAAAPRPALHAH